MKTLSHKFIEALAAPRDRLYTLALARVGTTATETALQQAARTVFHDLVRDGALDIPAAMQLALEKIPPIATPPNAPPPDSAMPADVWARLAATIQMEAAASSHATALAPDSVLLKPDPMLAPKKSRPRSPDADFDVSSPTRLLTFLGAIILVGLLLTLYIMTRPASTPNSPTPPNPASRPATKSTPTTTAPTSQF